ncbi:hypothetical protein PM082_024419 [Marasmius tenuissimus]|nr:hypothetical protein PM082_024419 [Marasmius tenuissimus]
MTDNVYPRRVAVDDTDPRVMYDTGTWNLDASSFTSQGVWGDPYNETMRGTNSATASFSFTFEGDYIQVKGAKDNSKVSRAPNSTHDSLDLLPKFTCQVDEIPIQLTEYRDYIHDTTNLILCDQANLPKQKHTLTMNITVGDPKMQVFWLDSIEYSPLDNADLTKEVVRVDSSDESCSYRNGTGDWKTDLDVLNTTDVTWATMSFKFKGTSVSMYGFTLPAATAGGIGNSTGYYSIDSGNPVSFPIPGSEPFPSEPGDIMWRNRRFFNTGQVDGGVEHEMIITYSGVHGNPKPPQSLAIDYFYVANNWVQVNGSAPGVGKNGERNGEKPGRKTSLGAIVGGVVGGVFALIAIAGLVWVAFKRRKRRSISLGESNNGLTLTSSSNSAEDSREEPAQNSQPLGGETSQTQSSEASANFASMKNAQRELVSGQRQEQDSGIRYTTTTLPPTYTVD